MEIERGLGSGRFSSSVDLAAETETDTILRGKALRQDPEGARMEPGWGSSHSTASGHLSQEGHDT